MNKKQYLPPDIYVRYDYPEEWENHRRQICPIFKLAKAMEQYKGKCSIMKDRLVIDGKESSTAPRNNLTELPQYLQPKSIVEKQNDNILCFLVGHSVFSNLHKAPFQVEGTWYTCTEQYI